MNVIGIACAFLLGAIVGAVAMCIFLKQMNADMSCDERKVVYVEIDREPIRTFGELESPFDCEELEMPKEVKNGGF